MKISPLAYIILDECKCGPEEFFVLVSSVYPGTDDELRGFLDTLSNLVSEGLLIASLHGNEGVQTITPEELHEYVLKRTKAGEPLDEYPTVCSEYRFITSDKGIDHLKAEDKPLNTGIS